MWGNAHHLGLFVDVFIIYPVLHLQRVAIHERGVVFFIRLAVKKSNRLIVVCLAPSCFRRFWFSCQNLPRLWVLRFALPVSPQSLFSSPSSSAIALLVRSVSTADSSAPYVWLNSIIHFNLNDCLLNGVIPRLIFWFPVYFLQTWRPFSSISWRPRIGPELVFALLRSTLGVCSARSGSSASHYR